MVEYSKLNYDYIKQAIEIPYLVWWNLDRRKVPRKPKRILIVNTCLIGDLTAALHSIRQYIKNHKHSTIDLLVSTPMKSVMQKIKGVHKVYPAKSVCNRSIDQINQQEDDITKNSYDLIIIVRLSLDAHRIVNNIKTKGIQVSSFSYIKYVLHLLRRILSREKVKQYSEANFEWLGEKPKYFSFNELFSFTKKDYQNIKEMDVMKGPAKKIIVHAGGGWQKDWENDRWAEVIKQVNKLGNFKFIFVGGEKKEEDNFNYIQSKLDFKIYSVIKKIDLAQLILMMRTSDYFIGIDSGPRNMAHLADLRSVSLLGPGPKHFMPTNKKDVIIDKSNCRCTHLFCFKKKTCIPKITAEDVVEGFKKLIK